MKKRPELPTRHEGIAAHLKTMVPAEEAGREPRPLLGELVREEAQPMPMAALPADVDDFVALKAISTGVWLRPCRPWWAPRPGAVLARGHAAHRNLGGSAWSVEPARPERHDYVYVLADAIHFNLRLEDRHQCILVVMGGTRTAAGR